MFLASPKQNEDRIPAMGVGVGGFQGKRTVFGA